MAFNPVSNVLTEVVGALNVQQVSTPSVLPITGYDLLYFKSDDNLYRLTTGGIELQLSGNLALNDLSNLISPTSINQSLWFASETFNIGQPALNRPLNVYVASSLHINGNDASAALEVSSTTQGFLPPRMNTTQRLAIASPAEGLIVYDTTLFDLYTIQDGVWKGFQDLGSYLTGLSGDVTAAGPGVSPAVVNFVGGAAAADIANATSVVDAATNLATPSTLVLRDSSGNFVSNAITLNSLVPNSVLTSNPSSVIASSSSTDVMLISTALNRGPSSGAVVREQYIDSITLIDNSSTNVAFSFPYSSYGGIEIAYLIKTGTATPDDRVGTLRIACNGITASISDTFSETSDIGIIWYASISGPNIVVQYVASNQGFNRSMRADIKQFRA